MIIYKLYKESLSITAHRQRVEDKKIDFYSFDQKTAKIIVQIKSPGDGKALEAVQDVLIALERGGKKAVHNMTVEDYNENLVSFVLPDNIISQSGSFLCGIYLDYGNNKSLDVGYFRINLKQSLIDKDLPAMEQFYVQSFEELKDDIIQRSSDLKVIIDGIDTDVADKLQTLDDLAEEYAQKAADLEATYAPRLTEVTAQLAQTMNKTAVTLSHQFADNAERDTYFTNNPEELTELQFIKVGTGYQQHINGSWEESSPVIAEAVNQIDDEKVSTDKTWSSQKIDDKKANREQEDWITPTLINGWSHGISGTRYYKDELGRVHLQLSLTGGSGTMFTLPIGYRPSTTQEFLCNSGGGVGILRVLTNGSVSRLSGSGDFVVSSGSSFRAGG